MKLENNFTIDAPVEKAWEALNNPETVAPCFPGATLHVVRGRLVRRHRQGEARADRDDLQGQGHLRLARRGRHEVVIEANGRDSRGNGTANATVTASLAADGADRTAVSMVTDMTITGKPAQFGRGVISDVADKIIDQFAACVARKLRAGCGGARRRDGGGVRGDVRHRHAPATARPARGGPGRWLRGDLGRGVGAGLDERGRRPPRRRVPRRSTHRSPRTSLLPRRPDAGDARSGDLRGGGTGVRGRDPGSGDRPAGGSGGDVGGGGAGGSGRRSRPRDDGPGDDPRSRGPHRGGPDGGRYGAACSGAQRGRRDRPARPAGAPVLQRLVPVLGGGLLLVLVVLLVRRLRAG